MMFYRYFVQEINRNYIKIKRTMFEFIMGTIWLMIVLFFLLKVNDTESSADTIFLSFIDWVVFTSFISPGVFELDEDKRSSFLPVLAVSRISVLQILYTRSIVGGLISILLLLTCLIPFVYYMNISIQLEILDVLKFLMFIVTGLSLGVLLACISLFFYRTKILTSVIIFSLVPVFIYRNNLFSELGTIYISFGIIEPLAAIYITMLLFIVLFFIISSLFSRKIVQKALDKGKFLINV